MERSSSSSQQLLTVPASAQTVSKAGQIQVSKKAWGVRMLTFLGLGFVMGYTIYTSMQRGDWLVVYSTIMPMHTFLRLFLAWIFYRNPSQGEAGNDLVSVIIPVYNQKSMIEFVIDALQRSTYKNIEIIAVNDGSRDGTKDILDNLAREYSNLKVIHQEKNQGKRVAVATGFYVSKGKYVVLIDSDSVVDGHAIEEFMKTFHANPKVGAVVGYAKALNAGKNVITKCQDAWYDLSFNLGKGAESVVGCVTCCSGCLCGYRREAISDFIPYWSRTKRVGEDRELTTYAIATPGAKTQLREIFGDKFWVPVSQKLMESMAQYDDAEDRGLTAHSIIEWESVYVATAIAYTDVPETWKGFLKQQTRWKKGFLRASFFVNTFLWRKHPVASFKYYTEFMATILAPLVNVIVLFYMPFILQDHLFTATIIGSTFMVSFIQGLDYKFRDPKSKTWMYKPLVDLVVNYVNAWLLFVALWQYRKNSWMTR